MRCPKCLTENDELIKTKGYGYGYIGYYGNCNRHKTETQPYINPYIGHYTQPNAKKNDNNNVNNFR